MKNRFPTYEEVILKRDLRGKINSVYYNIFVGNILNIFSKVTNNEYITMYLYNKKKIKTPNRECRLNEEAYMKLLRKISEVDLPKLERDGM